MTKKIQKQNILIVDDAPANISVLEEVLCNEYEVFFAVSGPEALKIAESSNPPDLVLLDIMMPGMDGYEVCRRLKKNKSTSNIPVIYITTKQEALDEAKGFETGAVDFITKPFNPITVKSRIKTHLDLKKHRDLLEALVTLRTAELSASNNKLVKEIEKSRKAGNALIESEKKYRLLVERMNDGLGVNDADGKVIYVNDRLCEMIGYSRDETIGKLTESFIAKESLSVFKKQVNNRKLGMRGSYEITIEGKNGNSIPMIMSSEPLYEDDGTYRGSFAVITDVSELKHAKSHIHALTQEILKVQEAERQRISRDLHDQVAQDLATLRMQCETLFDGHDEIPSDIRQRVAKWSRVIQDSIISVRELAYDLRPPILDQLGLVRTIDQYCDEFGGNNLVAVDFYSAGVEELQLGFDIEINLYRLIQEALNNIKRHSEASYVTVRLVASYPNLILRIEDDGKGFEVDKRLREIISEKRMGIRSMEERVNLLNGKMNIQSAVLEGTKIYVEVPYDKNGAEPSN